MPPLLLVQVAGVLWASMWVGSCLSVWYAVLLAYVGAFTVPVAYTALKPTLQSVTTKIRAATLVSGARGSL